MPPPLQQAQQQQPAATQRQQQQQEQQPSKRSRAARAAAKQAKLTGGTAPGSIKAFFKPTNLPAAAGSGGTGGAKGGNCYRCGSSDHVRLSTAMGGLACCALTVDWQCKLVQAPEPSCPLPCLAPIRSGHETAPLASESRSGALPRRTCDAAQGQ